VTESETGDLGIFARSMYFQRLFRVLGEELETKMKKNKKPEREQV